MNENKTASMLQRIPVILAVTAASYGLQVPAHAQRYASPQATTVRLSSVPKTLARLPGQQSTRQG